MLDQLIEKDDFEKERKEYKETIRDLEEEIEHLENDLYHYLFYIVKPNERIKRKAILKLAEEEFKKIEAKRNKRINRFKGVE